jgi:hypothetical protein
MSTGGIFDFPERRSISEQRQWNQYLASLDHEEDEDGLPLPVVETPPPKPGNANKMHRLSQESQDAWSDRMRARYGQEY